MAAVTTPDQKGAAPTNNQQESTEQRPAPVAAAADSTSSPPPAGEEGSPGRHLNVNAKSFVPRLDSTSSGPATPPPAAGKPTTKTTHTSGKKSGGGSEGSPRAGAGSSGPQQQHQHHQMPPLPYPYGQIPPYGLPGLSPLTMPPFPGFNPMLMSPVMVAAMAAAQQGRSGMQQSQSQHGIPQSPFASALANVSATMSASQHGIPQSPLTPANPPQSHVPVNVGNASLQALRASGPPRFACVLIVGMPRVGKTTIGRGLVSQLEDDGLKWAFFSGGDFLRDTPTRPAPWDTTKDVYDALSRKIDELQAQNGRELVKGLIIDKQCRGTEELYYLTALLKSKGLQLNGVVGLVADDDTRLMDRLGETDPAFREKLKFHRVIQTRIREASKSASLWHPVDALEDQDVVVRKVRSMVLGCSSQSPHKQLAPSNYHDGLSLMVDDYNTYATVMSELTKLTRMAKASQFPGFTGLTPLPNSIIAKKSALKEYSVRRRTDGTKYVLLYDGSNMYLVPRHMRAVFKLRNEAWLGIPLNSVAKFVLDGDLVRLSKERGKEKFLVQDVLCWHEKANPSTNMIARLGWKERQQRLTVNICGESSAFFSTSDVIVVLQTFVDIKNAPELAEPVDYSTDGYVFQPNQKRDDPVYFWRTPENVTVDFRLGPGIPTGEGTKRYSLQVFDQRQAKFVEYGTDTVTVQENRQFVVEGALVVCTLKSDEQAKSEGREWQYVRTRTDIPTAAFKSYVDDLLANCLIPKATVQTFLGIDPNAPRPTAPSTLAAASASGAAPAVGPTGPAAGTTSAPAAVPNPSFQQQGGSAGRTGFGSALETAPATTAGSTGGATLDDVVRGTVHRASAADILRRGTPAEAQQQQQQPQAGAARRGDDDGARRGAREDRGPRPTHASHNGQHAVAGAEANGTARPPRPERAAAGPVKKKCSDCGKFAEGEADAGDKQHYCFACWAIFEQATDDKKKGGNRRNNAAPREGNAPAARGQNERRERQPRNKQGDGADKTATPPPESGTADESDGKKKAPREPREPRARKPKKEATTDAPATAAAAESATPVPAAAAAPEPAVVAATA